MNSTHLLSKIMARQRASLYILLVLLVGQSACRPSTNRLGVAESGSTAEGRHWAQAAFSDWDTPNGKGALFFTGADASRDGTAHANIGFLRQERAGVDGFSVSHNILTAGVESEYGLMGRATVIDGTLHAGPVDLNYGVGFDTGISFKDGVEAMVAGVGGKIKPNEGVKVCFVVCLGANWG